MKNKIILVLVTVLFAKASFSQTVSGSGYGESKTTVSSGTKEATINGKPYSQYKAEQDALKQQGTKEITSVAAVTSINASSVQNPKTTKPATQPQEEYINKPNPTAAKVQDPLIVVAKQEETKTVAQILPAALKGTSMDPDAKPVMKAIENSNSTAVPQQNSGNTAVLAATKVTTQKTENTSADPKMIVQEEKTIKTQPAKIDPPKTEAAQLPADNGVKVSTPTKKD